MQAALTVLPFKSIERSSKARQAELDPVASLSATTIYRGEAATLLTRAANITDGDESPYQLWYTENVPA